MDSIIQPSNNWGLVCSGCFKGETEDFIVITFLPKHSLSCAVFPPKIFRMTILNMESVSPQSVRQPKDGSSSNSGLPQRENLAIVRVRVYFVDFFVFFVLRHR